MIYVHLLSSCYFLSLEQSPFVDDTGTVDTGSPPVDTPVPDTGDTHTGTVDTGDSEPVDTGDTDPVDTGDSEPVDSGDTDPVDTGDTDTGEPPCDTLTWYADGDGDGYGDDAATTEACDAPPGAVSRGGDCDDANAAANPGGTETLDDADNDCDGYVDAEGIYDVAASDFYAYIPEYDLSDTCSGASGTVYVDLSSSPEFDGTASCTSPNFGALTTALEGDVDGYDVDITSTSTYGSIEYSGSFSSDFTTFTATTSGSVELSGVLVEYSGEVNLVRR